MSERQAKKWSSWPYAGMIGVNPRLKEANIVGTGKTPPPPSPGIKFPIVAFFGNKLPERKIHLTIRIENEWEWFILGTAVSSCRGQVSLRKGTTYGNGDRLARGSQSGCRIQIIINPKRRVDVFEIYHGRQFRFAQFQPKYGRIKKHFWSVLVFEKLCYSRRSQMTFTGTEQWSNNFPIIFIALDRIHVFHLKSGVSLSPNLHSRPGNAFRGGPSIMIGCTTGSAQLR